MLSPPPALTGMPAARPSASAASARSAPTAEPVGERGGLGRGRRVVPQFRRAHRTVARIESDETVLLPGDTDARDLVPLAAKRLARGGHQRARPPGRVLLARAVVAL